MFGGDDGGMVGGDACMVDSSVVMSGTGRGNWWVAVAAVGSQEWSEDWSLVMTGNWFVAMSGNGLEDWSVAMAMAMAMSVDWSEDGSVDGSVD